ncbi:MAG: ZIP family metal transporter [Bacilli bacterium]|nr:ZIP family metal transporter [Bacilli bacterium]
MDKNQIALLTTLLLGIFILIGILITYIFNKKNNIVNFSIGLAFSVIIMLIVTDLLPEIMEEIELSKIYIFIICTALGFYILRVLDHFIPDHNDSDNEDNLIHIGVMTSLALGIHNVIEGMAIYSSVISDAKLGLALTIGVGFHNIPLGMVIGGTLHQAKEDKYKTIIYILLVTLSTFAGGLVMYFANTSELNSLVDGILLSCTLGMLMFILIDELFPRVIKNIKNKYMITGIILGIVLLSISMLF